MSKSETPQCCPECGSCQPNFRRCIAHPDMQHKAISVLCVETECEECTDPWHTTPAPSGATAPEPPCCAYVNHRPVDGPTCKVCGATVVGEKCLSCGEATPTPATPLKETEEGSLMTAANELLRELNAKVFGDHIDITKLPEAVGMCEDFAKAYAADLRSQVAESNETTEMLLRYRKTAERDLATAQARIARQNEILKEDLIVMAGILLGTKWELAPEIREELQKAHDLTMEALAEPQP